MLKYSAGLRHTLYIPYRVSLEKRKARIRHSSIHNELMCKSYVGCFFARPGEKTTDKKEQSMQCVRSTTLILTRKRIPVNQARHHSAR
jgi:hypothetical protein